MKVRMRRLSEETVTRMPPVAALVAFLLLSLSLLGACSSATPMAPGSKAAESSIVAATSSTTTAGSGANMVITLPQSGTVPNLNALPTNKPVDLVRHTQAPWLWSPVIAGTTLAWVEDSSFAAPRPLMGQAPQEDSAVIWTYDLETGLRGEIPGATIEPPNFESSFSFFPWWLLRALPGARDGAQATLVWAGANDQYDGNGVPRYQGLVLGDPLAEIGDLLPPEAMSLPPIRTGDVLALPLTSPAYENAHLGNVGTTLGEELGIVTGDLAQPVLVDPLKPVLPASALVGISPYASWYGFYTQGDDQFRRDLPGDPPRVFDLRTGKVIDISVEDPRSAVEHTSCAVAGKWAAWTAFEDKPRVRSLYLADLETGQARRIAEGDAPSGDIAISGSWLVWIDSKKGLSGFRLSSLSRFRIPDVLREGEEATGLQIAGGLVVMLVVDRGNIDAGTLGVAPPPRATSIRVIKLAQSS